MNNEAQFQYSTTPFNMKDQKNVFKFQMADNEIDSLNKDPMQDNYIINHQDTIYDQEVD